MDKKESGFDLIVTKRDEHTGLVTGKNPYILRYIAGADGGKVRLWERPAGSGNIWNKKNEPAGRYTREMKAGKWVSTYEPEASHIEWSAPETQDEKLAHKLTAQEAQIAALQKELASVKAESSVKAAGKNEKGS